MKSALLRPDNSPREDTDQAVNVRPYNRYQHAGNEHDYENDFETGHSDFSEHNNDNDNDYSDDDDDDEDDDDDDDRNEHDEEAGDWTNQFKQVFKFETISLPNNLF